jgi:hypothetical protein
MISAPLRNIAGFQAADNGLAVRAALSNLAVCSLLPYRFSPSVFSSI